MTAPLDTDAGDTTVAGAHPLDTTVAGVAPSGTTVASTDSLDTTIAGVTVTVDATAVRVRSLRPLRVLSSALVGGGFGETREIVNMHVDDVAPDSSPEVDLRTFATRLGIGESFVGLMTAAATEHARLAVAAEGALTAAAVVSVGLSNTVCAGVTAPGPAAPGTINAIVLLDVDLTPAAMVNAVITATEAKAMALGEWQVEDAAGAPASGTSTDAVVVACSGRGAPLDYAGPGTPIGYLLARAVRAAIGRICREKVARDGGRRGW